MKPLNKIKLSTLAVTLVFSTLALSATENNATTTNDWQSSLAAEFSKLDASGNGLLLPAEASKGKAFNKKTFAAADTDRDGTVDQNEYITYKTSMGATDRPGATTISSDTMSTAPESGAISGDKSTSEMSNKEMTGSEMTGTEMNNTKMTGTEMSNTSDKTAEMSQDTANTNRPVGAVVDDSLITTKAKAAIFGTPDLKSLQISVETRQGEVTLTGLVDNDAVKMKAEEVVKSVEGVSSVTNKLEVKS